MLLKTLKLKSNLLVFLFKQTDRKGKKNDFPHLIELGIQSEHAVHFPQQQMKLCHKVFQIFQVIGISCQLCTNVAVLTL